MGRSRLLRRRRFHRFRRVIIISARNYYLGNISFGFFGFFDFAEAESAREGFRQFADATTTATAAAHCHFRLSFDSLTLASAFSSASPFAAFYCRDLLLLLAVSFRSRFSSTLSSTHLFETSAAAVTARPNLRVGFVRDAFSESTAPFLFLTNLALRIFADFLFRLRTAAISATAFRLRRSVVLLLVFIAMRSKPFDSVATNRLRADFRRCRAPYRTRRRELYRLIASCI
jgi:hypothetical protein